MNDLINLITPLTRGIIWIPKGEISDGPYYTKIDYLLDGLLTANINASPQLSSRLIVGQNFGKPLYVMILSDIIQNEVESFVTLIKKDLVQENDITVIDEKSELHRLRNDLKDIHNHLRSI